MNINMLSCGIKYSQFKSVNNINNNNNNKFPILTILIETCNNEKN